MEETLTLVPKASIVIVTYNNVAYTRLCLKSIYGKTTDPNFEVIVIDNASTDNTKEFLKELAADHENLRVIYNVENQGFARANNLGIAEARGDYIVLLNNDTIITPHWLSKLIRYASDPQVGLVGSLTNGAWNEVRIEVPFTDDDALDAFAGKIAEERANILTPIRMLAMYCVVGRKEVFQQVGPLDEQFGVGMFEDDDYALRVRQAGYQIMVAEDVFIHHFGQSAFKLLGDARYRALFEENRRKFETKWNMKWEPYVTSGLAENRRYTADLRNILEAHPTIKGVVIFPPTTGWNISLFQAPFRLEQAFSEMGFLVFVYSGTKQNDLNGFKQIGPGLFMFNCPWAVFDVLERPVILTLPYNREYIFQLRQPFVVYELTEDLDLFPGDQTQLQQNHDILLRDADIIVTTSDRQVEAVKHIRPDTVRYKNAAEWKSFSQGEEFRSSEAQKIQWGSLLEDVKLVLNGYRASTPIQAEKRVQAPKQALQISTAKPADKAELTSLAHTGGINKDNQLSSRPQTENFFHWLSVRLSLPHIYGSPIMQRGKNNVAALFNRIRRNRRLEEDLILMRSSGFFDEIWYLAKNPDVSQAKVDPLLHYLYHGGFEGRDPSPQFSSLSYLTTYEDVKRARINPLLHYLKYGRLEGRAISPVQETLPSPSGEIVKGVVDQLVRKSLKGIFIVTSGFAFEELFNQRVINLSTFLAREGWGVIYVAWRWNEAEEIPIGKEVYPNIFQLPVDIFLKNTELFAQIQSSQKYFIVEFPYPGFFRSALQLRRHGFKLIYEIIDEWEEFHKVGQALWFNKAFENAFVINANIVTAVTSPLIEKFSGLRQGIHLSPNGYTPALLGKAYRNIARRDQMKKDQIHLGYFGHLTESWFDWDFLLGVLDLARQRKFKLFVDLIGYGEPDVQQKLVGYSDQVKFYGKIHPSELHRHVKRWDAAMIWFRSGKLSAAVDPIKIYEYLYFGLPTIVKGIDHLRDFPLTHVVENENQVLEVLIALQKDGLRQLREQSDAGHNVEQMLTRSTWEQRFTDLLRILESEKKLDL